MSTKVAERFGAEIASAALRDPDRAFKRFALRTVSFCGHRQFLSDNLIRMDGFQPGKTGEVRNVERHNTLDSISPHDCR
jgi:hypothetical protein